MSYDHYRDVRGEIALPKDDLIQIDASGSSQVCSTFGMHPNLAYLKSLYEDGDLAWVANMGVLPEHVTKNNWNEKTSTTVLFAHNIQYEEVHNMDIYERQTGRGLGGRMTDVLKRKGYSPNSVSLFGTADVINSNEASSFILDPYIGLENFNPNPSWGQPLWDNVKKLNAKTNIGSSLFGETWSNTLIRAVSEIELLKEKLDRISLLTPFGSENELSPQLELIAKLIKSRDSRGEFVQSALIFVISYDRIFPHYEPLCTFNTIRCRQRSILCTIWWI